MNRKKNFLWRCFRNLRRDTKASVAVETAIILPLLVILSLGVWELYLYMRTSSNIDRCAYTVGDLVSRKSKLNKEKNADDSDNIGAYFQAAIETASPADLKDDGEVILTAIHNDGTSTEIAWQESAEFSDGKFKSALMRDGTLTLVRNDTGDALTLRTGETLIVAEIFLDYHPFIMAHTFLDNLPVDATLYRRAVFMARTTGLETLQ